VFQRDSAPAHQARETVDLLTKETPESRQTNSTDLNAVDYKVWLVVQKKVYKKQIKDVDELSSCDLTA